VSWLTTEAVQTSDVVITMRCGDACPIFLGKRYLAIRPIRNEIDRWVRELLAEFVPATA
jgi:hypothetical protein